MVCGFWTNKLDKYWSLCTDTSSTRAKPEKQHLLGILGEPQGDPALTLFAADDGGANGLLLAAAGANGLTVGPDRLRRSSLGLVASEVGEPAANGSTDGWLVVVVLVLNGLVAILGALLVGDSFSFCS